MSDYDERMILAQRNINALNEGLKLVETRRTADAKRVEDLMATVTQLQTQVQKLIIDMAVLKAGSVGRGSTT
jgi:hypothetical protein